MTDHLDELTPVLREKDGEFRRIFEEHRTYEERLADLQSRHFLSEDEKLEETELKKKKLILKDRMVRIAQRHGAPVGG